MSENNIILHPFCFLCRSHHPCSPPLHLPVPTPRVVPATTLHRAASNSPYLHVVTCHLCGPQDLPLLTFVVRPLEPTDLIIWHVTVLMYWAHRRWWHRQSLGSRLGLELVKQYEVEVPSHSEDGACPELHQVARQLSPQRGLLTHRVGRGSVQDTHNITCGGFGEVVTE
jgi:hypothetical protein